MSVNISGFGLQARVIASKTYPAGITVTQFADDADPFDTPSMDIADDSMGLNGDLLIAEKATTIRGTLAMVPGSDDDKLLAILFEANRVGKGKKSARDKITLTVMYPDGTQTTHAEGLIKSGMPSKSVASAGRYKSMVYGFAFENKVSS